MAEATETEVTTTTTVVAVAAGNPPSLTTIKRAVSSQGVARHITQKVAVRDEALFKRLCAEVSRGDEIRVILVTDFSAKDYMMSLVDFAKTVGGTAAALPVRELASQAA